MLRLFCYLLVCNIYSCKYHVKKTSLQVDNEDIKRQFQLQLGKFLISSSVNKGHYYWQWVISDKTGLCHSTACEPLLWVMACQGTAKSSPRTLLPGLNRGKGNNPICSTEFLLHSSLVLNILKYFYVQPQIVVG